MRPSASACCGDVDLANETTGISEVQDAGHVCGSELTHTMAERQIWLHAPALPETPQGHLQGEERGLCEVGALQQRGGVATGSYLHYIHVSAASLVR